MKSKNCRSLSLENNNVLLAKSCTASLLPDANKKTRLLERNMLVNIFFFYMQKIAMGFKKMNREVVLFFSFRFFKYTQGIFLLGSNCQDFYPVGKY